MFDLNLFREEIDLEPMQIIGSPQFNAKDPADIEEGIANLREKFEKDMAQMVSWVPKNVNEKIKELRINFEKDIENIRRNETRLKLKEEKRKADNERTIREFCIFKLHLGSIYEITQ